MRPTSTLAGLCPVAVLGLALGWMAAPRAFLASARAREVEADLARKAPEVLVVGNSTVGAGVDEARLSRLLGRQAARVHEKATSAATWYLILKNRVFEAGMRPKLVVVGSFASAMTQVRPGELESETLSLHMGEHEPLLARLTFGQPSRPAWRDRLDRRRAEWRRAMLAAPRGLIERAVGEEEVADALSAVFDEETALDHDLGRGVLPVAAGPASSAAVGPRSRPAPADGYIPAILDLCQAHGARVVFARFPLRPGTPTDTASAEEVQALIELLNRRGAGWVDLGTLGLGADSFQDPLHANADGRRRLTDGLYEALQRLGALKDGALAPTWLLRSTPLQRGGAGPAAIALSTRSEGACAGTARLPAGGPTKGLGRLDALGLAEAAPIRLTLGPPDVGEVLTIVRTMGEGCSGSAKLGPVIRFSPDAETPRPADLWLSWDPAPDRQDNQGRRWTWLLPGTELSTRLSAEAPPGEGRLHIEARLLRLHDGASAPEVLLDGRALAMELDGQRSVYRATLPPGPMDGLPLVLRAAADAPLSLVETVRVRGDDERQDVDAWIVGSAGQAGEGRARYLGGRGKTMRFTAEPPVLEQGEARRDGPIWRITLPGAAPLDGASLRRARLGPEASPLRLALDGQPMDARAVHCARLEDSPTPAFCQEGDELHVRLAEGAAGRPSVALDPTRGDGKRWLYPGDAVLVQGNPREAGQIRGGARSVYLRARSLGLPQPDEVVRLRVLVRGAAIFEARIPLRELDGTERWLDLPKAAPALTVPSVELARGPGTRFMVVEELGLAETLAPRTVPLNGGADEPADLPD